MIGFCNISGNQLHREKHTPLLIVKKWSLINQWTMFGSENIANSLHQYSVELLFLCLCEFFINKMSMFVPLPYLDDSYAVMTGTKYIHL